MLIFVKNIQLMFNLIIVNLSLKKSIDRMG